MNTFNVTIPARNVMDGMVMSVTIKVKGVKRRLWRLAMAKQLIKFAAFVAGFKSRVEQEWEVSIGD